MRSCLALPNRIDQLLNQPLDSLTAAASLRYRIRDRIYKTGQTKTFPPYAATITAAAGNTAVTWIITAVGKVEWNAKLLATSHDVGLGLSE